MGLALEDFDVWMSAQGDYATQLAEEAVRLCPLATASFAALKIQSHVDGLAKAIHKTLRNPKMTQGDMTHNVDLMRTVAEQEVEALRRDFALCSARTAQQPEAVLARVVPMPVLMPGDMPAEAVKAINEPVATPGDILLFKPA